MAYSLDIPNHRCHQCGARATKSVFNRVNGLVGYYCSRHADSKVNEISASERDGDKRKAF